jgi:predicted RND superfamily exporter protein
MKSSSSNSLLRRFLALCVRRGDVILAFALLSTALGAWLATSVRIDTRLEALLPEDARSVQALEEAERRVPVRSTLFLLITSPDAAMNRELSEALAEEVSGWEETRWAVTARSPEGLWDRRILFAPAEDLEGWATAVEDRLAWERCDKVPGCVNFDDRPPLPTEADVRARLAEVPELASLARFFGEKGDAATAGQGSDGATDGMPDGRLCNEDGTLCAVEASLSVSARNMATATEILDRAQAMIDRLRPADAPDSLRVEVSGPFRNAPLTKRATERDLGVVSVVSAALVLAVLLGMFRGLRPAFIILAPMVMATAWVLGLVGLLDIELNLISAFTFAILVGIGTDYGLHLASHYGAERARGHGAVDAMEGTLRSLGLSLTTAAATTAFAFASLMVADFKGFAQMGGLAAIGIGACLVAYLFFVPPMVLFFDRVLPQKRSWNRQVDASESPAAPRFARTRVLLGLVLGLGLAYAGRNVEVETDFRKLRPEGIAHGLATNDAVHGTSGVGIQVIGDDPAAVASATWAVRDATIDGFLEPENAMAITAETFIPADQSKRLAAVARLREALDDAARLGSDRDRERIDAIRPLVAVDQPITAEELPPWISDWLVDNSGEIGHLGLVFLRTRGTDAVLMEQLARILDHTAEAHPDVVIASAQVVLGEVLPGLFHDGPVMVALSLFGLCLSVWILGRKLTRVGWVLLPLLLGTTMTVGFMALFDLKLTLYNLLVLPVAFGVGVDGAVYVTYASEAAESADASHDAMADSRRAIIGATLTTVSGFGSLALSHHLGIVSIGYLGALAIAVTMFTNLVWLPPLLYLFGERGRRRRAA